MPQHRWRQVLRDGLVVLGASAVLLLVGDPVRGRREIARATRLKGSELEPGDRRFVPYLAEALEQAALRLPDPDPAGGW